MKVFVCTSCCVDSGSLLEAVQVAIPEVTVEGIDCMSGCARAQTVAVRSQGKVAYLFGDITQGDLPELQNFVTLYGASEDGHFQDARVLGGLRLKALARIPA